MTRVLHNGAECAFDRAGCAHLGDLIRECLPADSVQVTSVRVNGCDLPEESLDKLEAFPLEGIEEVELATLSSLEVARASLDSATDYAVSIVAAVSATANHLRAGRIGDANRMYAQVTDALSVLLFALTAAAQQLGEEGEVIGDVESEIHPWLESLLAAQKAQDWLRVADYLDFEVAPLLEQWRTRIAAIRAPSSSAAGSGGPRDASAAN